MKKLTITWLSSPKEVTTKFGPKQKNSIKASDSEYKDNYLSFWVSPVTRDWKVGDTVEVLDVTSREYNDKTYYDIVMPKANSTTNPEVMAKLDEILSYLAKFNLHITELVEHKRRDEKPKITGTDIDYPTPSSEGIDIDAPF